MPLWFSTRRIVRTCMLVSESLSLRQNLFGTVGLSLSLSVSDSLEMHLHGFAYMKVPKCFDVLHPSKFARVLWLMDPYFHCRTILQVYSCKYKSSFLHGIPSGCSGDSEGGWLQREPQRLSIWAGPVLHPEGNSSHYWITGFFSQCFIALPFPKDTIIRMLVNPAILWSSLVGQMFVGGLAASCVFFYGFHPDMNAKKKERLQEELNRFYLRHEQRQRWTLLQIADCSGSPVVQAWRAADHNGVLPKLT